MGSHHQYLVTVESYQAEHRECGNSNDESRPDAFEIQRKDAERRQINATLSSACGDFMKLLTTLSTAGVGAMLFKAQTGSFIAASQVLALVFMAFSLLFAVMAYIYSIYGLYSWSKELTNLNKQYEEMEQCSSVPQLIFVVFSLVFFVLSAFSYFCYVK